MKRFLFKCLAFALILGVIFLPITLLLDPYNVFHPDNIRNNGIEPNKNFVKMRNVITHPDRYDSFLFGSSRMGFFNVERMNDGTYYDMAYSEGLPGEHLDNLKVMLRRGIVPKNIVIGLDDISYFVDYKLHDEQLYRLNYPWDGKALDKLGFYLKYFDLLTTSESIEVIAKHKNTDPIYGERLLTTGTENLAIVPEFNYSDVAPTWADYYMPRPEVFDEIQEIIDICDEWGIGLRFFTNPINAYTYQKDITNGYLIFLEQLAQVTDYYNFSGFSDVTMNYTDYYETSHFDYKIADMVIDRIFYGKKDSELEKQGFGVYVTRDNVGELMDILYNQAVDFGLPTNTFQDVGGPSAVADLIER